MDLFEYLLLSGNSGEVPPIVGDQYETGSFSIAGNPEYEVQFQTKHNYEHLLIFCSNIGGTSTDPQDFPYKYPLMQLVLNNDIKLINSSFSGARIRIDNTNGTYGINLSDTASKLWTKTKPGLYYMNRVKSSSTSSPDTNTIYFQPGRTYIWYAW